MRSMGSGVFCGVVMLVASLCVADEFESDSEQPGIAATPIATNEVFGQEPCVDSGARCTSRRNRCESRYYASAEALFLRLDDPDDRVLALNQNTLATALSTDDLDLGTEAGPRFTFGYAPTACGALEVSYFGLHDWDANATAIGNNDLRIPGDLALSTDDFFGADSIRADYAAELHNAEINLFRNVRDSDLSFLLGFRYLNYTEDFLLTSADSDTEISNYRIGTENNLFGAQVGSLLRKQFGIFGFRLIGKAGLFGVDAKQRTFVGDFGNTFVFRDSRTDGGDLAFVGELGLHGTIRLTDRWHVISGYNLIWVDGVARAPEQTDFSDTPASGLTLNDDGSLFLHGASVGLEARF